jgi:methionine-S-sulfoxide reductase
VNGVIKTEVGYIGGHLESPTYQQVCSGTTGHVEAVLVTYNPRETPLEEILMIYFETHNFSQSDGQGPDIGSQYLSVMFYENNQEKEVMTNLIRKLKELGHCVATAVKPRATFWRGEDYHQNYYERKGDTPYCHIYRPIFPRTQLSRAFAPVSHKMP